MDPDELIIADVTEIGAFDWRWPANVEQFNHGWEYVVGFGGHQNRIRHGVGGRKVFGKDRVHTVTWIGGQPMVEGVAADDYTTTRALISFLRTGGRQHVRRLADMPPGYEAFEVVRHQDEIVAKHSSRSLCIKVREDDLASWALHAIPQAKPQGPSKSHRGSWREKRWLIEVR